MVVTFENLENIVKAGFNIERDKVSLNIIKRLGRTSYQVHSDNPKFKYSELYDDVHISVDKMALILNQIREGTVSE